MLPCPISLLEVLVLILIVRPRKTRENEGHVRTMTFDGSCELHKIRRTLDTMRQVTSEAVPNEEELDVDLLLRIRVPDQTSTTPLGEKFGATFEECASLARVHCCLLQKQASDTRSNCPSVIMSDRHSQRPWIENHRGQVRMDMDVNALLFASTALCLITCC